MSIHFKCVIETARCARRKVSDRDIFFVSFFWFTFDLLPSLVLLPHGTRNTMNSFLAIDVGVEEDNEKKIK